MMKSVVIKVIVSIIAAVAVSGASMRLYQPPAATTSLQVLYSSASSGILMGGGPDSRNYTDAVKLNLVSNLSINSRSKAVITSLDVMCTKENRGDYLSQVLFTTDMGWSFEGVACACRAKNGFWTVESIGCAPINTGVPFTQLEASYTSDSDQRYFWVSGVVNDKNITNISIVFSDGITAQVAVDSPSDTYAYLRDGETGGIKYIKGFSGDNRLIYQYN